MEIKMQPELLNLPWATLLTLACGYAGYYVANVGIREHHKPIDVAFSTLVFGFFAAFAYTFCRRVFAIDILSSSLIAFIIAILLGLFWTKAGRNCLEWLLRRCGVSTDDLPSAWMALFVIKASASQLTVQLKDGTWLMCDDLSRFADRPNGPCVFGGKGDLLLYVTHRQSKYGADFEDYTQTEDEEWGDMITFIPADQIARVDYRRKRLK